MDAELRVQSMVMSFRVTELQNLLSFAGKNKTGRKNELQARCLELVKIKSPPISMKIKDLYKSIQMTTMGNLYSGNTNSSSNASNYNNATTASSMAPRSYNSGYNNDSTKILQQENQYSRGYSYPANQRVITVDGQCRSIPLCPDVAMKKLPFYDIEAVLLRPTSLLSQGHNPKQEAIHTFCLTPSQASEISKSRQVIFGPDTPITKIQYSIQVQLRFCALDASEEQDDLFPPNLNVKVNGRPIQLPHAIPSNRPGVEPKRPSRPLNITSNVKCCPHSTNSITIQWMSDTKSYAMQVTMVSKLNAEELLLRLKSKRIQPSDFTRGRIKEITTTEEEDLCAPTSIRVTVACPLGKSRMTYPCRASTCKHLQCFDANAFLLMNEKKPSFVCPVCNKHLKFDDLHIDGYFMDVIQKLSLKDGNDIELFPNGTWEPAIRVKNEIEDIGPPPKRIKSEIKDSKINSTIDLDDDICIVDDVTSNSTDAQAKSKSDGKKGEPEVIDLIDSSDEEEEPAPTEQPPETEVSPSPAPPEEEDDDEEEEIGIRPRRRKPRINYVEESSSDSSTTNEGIATDSPARVPRSPACIELSDSPTPSPQESRRPELQHRPFASVSSSSRSAPQANRSGSGTSTMYSSSATAHGANPGAIGSGMTLHSASSDYYSRSTFPPSLSSPALMAPASSLLYPTPSTTTGYTAYDASTTWEGDLNSFINPAAFCPGDLTYDFLSTPPGYDYDPRSSRGGGTYPRWT